jgi:aspartate/methionine/tyrosine aminotransferase
MKPLAQAAYHIDGQPMFKVLAKAQALEQAGRRILHFEIGDPDFDTPGHIAETAFEALRQGYTHYTNSMGLAEFRDAACEATWRSRGFHPTREQVLVTPGANVIIYYVVRCVVNPGEEVILPDPGFPSYYSVLKFTGAVPVRVPLREKDGFRMAPDEVRSRITDRTRLIIMNSPHNPTGAVMTPSEIDEVARIAEERDLYLLSDEIYARMLYDFPFRSPSARDLCQERTIVANGFSKSYAMTGWRLGVAIGPEPLIEKMGLLLQTTTSCVSPFIQKAGIAALRGDQAPIVSMMEEFKRRRNLLVEGLNSLLGVSCVKPDGAFYVFPNITKTGMTSEAFADFMLEEAGVTLLPGTNFGQHGEGYVRLSYATSVEKIREGLEAMRSALTKRRASHEGL